MDVMVAAQQGAGAAGTKVGFFSTLAWKLREDGVARTLAFSTRGLVARVCFGAAGVPYTNKIVSVPEFKDMKPTLPLGQLPILTLPSGRVVEYKYVLTTHNGELRRWQPGSRHHQTWTFAAGQFHTLCWHPMRTTCNLGWLIWTPLTRSCCAWICAACYPKPTLGRVRWSSAKVLF
jgi:hypothetical protein